VKWRHSNLSLCRHDIQSHAC